MHWSDFLDSQHPSAVADSPFISDASHLCVVRASGKDAGNYLQGQLTCDLREVDAGRHHTAMHLNLKGRGIASLRIAKDNDDYLLITPRGCDDSLISALEKYRLRSQITLTRDDTLQLFGMAGELPTHTTAGHCSSDEHGLWLRYAQSDNALLVVASEQAQATWTTLASTRQRGTANTWRLADIAAGEALLEHGADDRFLPQALNYDVTGGIHFQKGCYTGQEVVARMHFKGKMKQRMQRAQLTCESTITLHPAQTLRDEAGKACAEVVSVATLTEDSQQVEALLVAPQALPEQLFLNEQKLDATWLALPYSVPWKD